MIFSYVSRDADIITIESLQWDLATIEAATNNFSLSNKLGQGGFGEVYKVCNHVPCLIVTQKTVFCSKKL